MTTHLPRFGLLPLCLALVPALALAQRGGKKPGGQMDPAEMAELQKEMEKARRDDPNVDQIMKQMGLDQKMKNAERIMKHGGPGPVDERGLPRKDAARIARAGTGVMSDGELKAFLQRVSAEVEQKISAKQRENGAKVLEALRARKASAATLASAASGLWVVGAREAALYVMGRAAAGAPSNPDAANNYAAFLTMSGGEELALPILRTLDKRFPRNSTVKNNLGQAWFGLGDIEQAEKHLDEAIRIFGYHSQANFTKSVIQEARGDKPGAAESMRRSIQFGFSQDKQNALRRTGFKAKGRYLAWPFRAPQDPLGLHLFQVPPYPKSSSEAAALEPVWEAFKADTRRQLEEWNARARKLEPEAQKAAQARVMAGFKTRSIGAVLPPYFAKASLLQGAASEQATREMAAYGERFKEASARIAKLGEEHRARAEKISEGHVEDFGEGGKDSTGGALCRDLTAENDKYLETVNSLHEKIQGESLELTRRRINDSTYYAQFQTGDPAAFELVKAHSKRDFLEALNGLQHATVRDPCTHGKSRAQKVKLADFYDIRCDYHTDLDFVFTKIAVDCNKMTTQIDIPGFSGNLEENLDTGRVIQGSAELALASRSISVGKGPLSAEAEVGVKGYVEFTGDGVTDWGLRGEASVKVGGDLYQNTTLETANGEFEVPVPSSPSVKLGTEFQIGWNSGPSLDGKGTLNGGMASARSAGK